MDDETHALLSYCTVGKFNSGSIFYQGNLATDINIINHSKVYLFILLILRKTSQKRYSYMDFHIGVNKNWNHLSCTSFEALVYWKYRPYSMHVSIISPEHNGELKLQLFLRMADLLICVGMTNMMNEIYFTVWPF